MSLHTLRHGRTGSLHPEIPLFTFAATLFVYALLNRKTLDPGEIRYAFWRNYYALAIGGGLLIAGLIAMAFSWPSWNLAGAGLVLVLAYTYSLPWYGKPLRQWPYAKVFLIAVVWTLITAAFPLVASDPSYAAYHLVLDLPLILARFAFIVAITLPFDLRDQEADLREGTLTLPLRLGWPRARRIALLALAISALLEIVWFQNVLLGGPIAAVSVTCHVTALTLILLAREDRKDDFYTFWLDGVLVLPLLLGLLVY